MIILFYVEHYFWLLMLIIGIWSVFQDQTKISKSITDSTQQKLALKINIGQGIILNFPWLIMGLGFLDPKITTIFRFIQPFPAKPWVWIFYASVLLCWTIGFVWIFFLKGDKTLVELPPLFAIHGKTIGKIRFLYILSLVGVIAVFAVLVHINPVHFYQ